MKHFAIKNTGRAQRGFSLVAAIFLIVVLAFLGVMMVTVSQMERETTTAAVQGARAYHAARTGLEWGIFQAAAPAGPGSCVASTTFPLAVAGLNGFSVTVGCTSTSHRERADTFNVFVITSTATFGTFGNPDYVSRTLTVTATDLP